MTETRVIIPGAQALLGFAGITTLMDSFDSLPQTAKTVHLVGLLAVALSVVLLMTPVAYHRLTGHGEDTEEFYQVASRLVIAAMFPLAVSLAAELFVVVFKVTGSVSLAILTSGFALLVFVAAWYVFPLLHRKAA
jgi:hypothetical protein